MKMYEMFSEIKIKSDEFFKSMNELADKVENFDYEEYERMKKENEEMMEEAFREYISKFGDEGLEILIPTELLELKKYEIRKIENIIKEIEELNNEKS